MSLNDATASVVHHVFARLVEQGFLPRQMFVDIAAAYDDVADEALCPEDRTTAVQVADVARLIMGLAEELVVEPVLRVVQPERPLEAD